MLKYRTWFNVIEVFEVKGETESLVILLNGRREAKRSSVWCYFDTWEEAHNFLLERAEKEVKKAKLALERAEIAQRKIYALREE